MAFEIEIEIRDAQRAQDLFRDQFAKNGKAISTNTYYFPNSETAFDFKAALQSHNIGIINIIGTDDDDEAGRGKRISPEGIPQGGFSDAVFDCASFQRYGTGFGYLYHELRNNANDKFTEKVFTTWGLSPREIGAFVVSRQGRHWGDALSFGHKRAESQAGDFVNMFKRELTKEGDGSYLDGLDDFEASMAGRGKKVGENKYTHLLLFRLFDSNYGPNGNPKTLSVTQAADNTIHYSFYGGHQASGTGFSLSNLQMKKSLPASVNRFKNVKDLKRVIELCLSTGVGSHEIKDVEILNEIAKTPPPASGIPNNYAGKNAAQVWDAWDASQRRHFVTDHSDYPTDEHDMLRIVNQKSNEIQPAMLALVEEHITTGQYGAGTRVAPAMANVLKVERHYLKPGNVINEKNGDAVKYQYKILSFKNDKEGNPCVFVKEVSITPSKMTQEFEIGLVNLISIMDNGGYSIEGLPYDSTDTAHRALLRADAEIIEKELMCEAVHAYVAEQNATLSELETKAGHLQAANRDLELERNAVERGYNELEAERDTLRAENAVLRNEGDVLAENVGATKRGIKDTLGAIDAMGAGTRTSEPEVGAAAVTVQIKGGKLTVHHMDIKTKKQSEKIIDRPAFKGEWNKIWAALEGAKTPPSPKKKEEPATNEMGFFAGAESTHVGNKEFINEHGVHSGYSKTKWDFARKAQYNVPFVGNTEIPYTVLGETNTAARDYLDTLPIFQMKEVPKFNPDLGDGPITENYIISDDGDSYFFVDTQGYDYVRYITRLDGWAPNETNYDYGKGTRVAGTKVKGIMDEKAPPLVWDLDSDGSGNLIVDGIANEDGFKNRYEIQKQKNGRYNLKVNNTKKGVGTLAKCKKGAASFENAVFRLNCVAEDFAGKGASKKKAGLGTFIAGAAVGAGLTALARTGAGKRAIGHAKTKVTAPPAGKGMYTVPVDKKVLGNYVVEGNGFQAEIEIVGFEAQDATSQSLYQPAEADHHATIGSLIVKNTLINKLETGKPVTAISSKTNEKVKITRIGNLGE